MRFIKFEAIDENGDKYGVGLDVLTIKRVEEADVPERTTVVIRKEDDPNTYKMQLGDEKAEDEEYVVVGHLYEVIDKVNQAHASLADMMQRARGGCGCG